MRLNIECIRDLLLTVEDHTGFNTAIKYSGKDQIFERLAAYEPDEVFYHIKQAELSGLLTKVTWYLSDGCLIHDLSPSGHAFIADIRNNTNWNKTKKIAEQAGSFSLDLLKVIAAGVAKEFISGSMRLL